MNVFVRKLFGVWNWLMFCILLVVLIVLIFNIVFNWKINLNNSYWNFLKMSSLEMSEWCIVCFVRKWKLLSNGWFCKGLKYWFIMSDCLSKCVSVISSDFCVKMVLLWLLLLCLVWVLISWMFVLWCIWIC